MCRYKSQKKIWCLNPSLHEETKDCIEKRVPSARRRPSNEMYCVTCRIDDLNQIRTAHWTGTAPNHHRIATFSDIASHTPHSADTRVHAPLQHLNPTPFPQTYAPYGQRLEVSCLLLPLPPAEATFYILPCSTLTLETPTTMRALASRNSRLSFARRPPSYTLKAANLSFRRRPRTRPGTTTRRNSSTMAWQSLRTRIRPK
jgi:hypothetical protein